MAKVAGAEWPVPKPLPVLAFESRNPRSWTTLSTVGKNPAQVLGSADGTFMMRVPWEVELSSPRCESHLCSSQAIGG